MPSTLLGEHATTIPTGTTAERPASPVDGMLRYNTTINKLEYYNSSNSTWIPVQEQ